MTAYFTYVINQIGEKVKTTVGIANEKGDVIACTNAKQPDGKIIIRYPHMTQRYQDDAFVYRPFCHRGTVYYLFTDEKSEAANAILSLVEMMCVSSYDSYKYQFDPAAFFLKLWNKQLSIESIDEYARKNGISDTKEFTVFAVRGQYEIDVKILKNQYVNASNIFFVPASDFELFIVIQMNETYTQDMLLSLVEEICETINRGYSKSCTIGICTTNEGLAALSCTFDRAMLCTTLASFFPNEPILYYQKTWLARLIRYVPVPLCRAYLREALPKTVANYGDMEYLDPEYRKTLLFFLENDLNIQKTADKMFIHRNTLSYRLDRLEKMLGYDVRKFEDAMFIQIAMLLRQYCSAEE